MNKYVIESILNGLAGYKCKAQEFITLFLEKLAETYGAVGLKT
jgi:hypothetical protein